MKSLLLSGLLALTIPLVSAQSNADTIKLIRQKVSDINSQTPSRLAHLSNSHFLDSLFLHQPAQGYGTLTAFFKDNTIYKIKQTIGLKLLHQTAYTDYYFHQGKLIYVYEEEDQGPDIIIDSAGTVDMRIDMPAFTAHYYFSNDKMISRVEEGQRQTMLLPDQRFFDSQSKEGQLLYSAAKYYRMFLPADEKENTDHQQPVNVMEAQKIKLHLLQKLSIAGNFDGEGQQEILFQYNFSTRFKKEIIHAADPFNNEWDTVVQWFYRQQPDIYLNLQKKNSDTLHLGSGQGLYCLINIGDNNHDGKDEIALVVDYLDFSRVNTCKIYSLCQNKWQLLKEFGIHEGSFDFENNNNNIIPTFTEIKEFLEKHNGQWLYKDYLNDFTDKRKDVGKMKKLKLNKCR